MIEIQQSQADRINLILGGLKGAPDKAFSSIINRGLATVRSQSSKGIRSIYNITHSNLRADSNITLKKAGKSNLSGEIMFSGFKIPLARFSVSPNIPGSKKPLKISVLRPSSPTLLQHAFLARTKSGHLGIFERIPGQYMGSRIGRSKHSEKIGANTNRTTDQFYGPAAAQMASNSLVLTQIEAAAQETINKRVEHEITRILNGRV